MEKNVGGLDKGLRVVAGVVLLAAGFSDLLGGWMKAAALVVGVVALSTGFFGF